MTFKKALADSQTLKNANIRHYDHLLHRKSTAKPQFSPTGGQHIHSSCSSAESASRVTHMQYTTYTDLLMTMKEKINT